MQVDKYNYYLRPIYTDNVINFKKHALTKPLIILVLFNQTNWNLSVLHYAYNGKLKDAYILYE